MLGRHNEVDLALSLGGDWSCGISANFDPLDHWPERQCNHSRVGVPRMVLLYLHAAQHRLAAVPSLSQGMEQADLRGLT